MKRFQGAKDNPDDSTDFLVPQVAAPASTGWTAESLGDYFGLPIGYAGITANALPFRGYNLIYNTWFKDQNLIDDVPVEKGDALTPDAATLYPLLRRCKRHDYFTSCLPWPQKVIPSLSVSVALLPFSVSVLPTLALLGLF